MAYRFPFPPYPNGWFAIGFSPDFAIGEVVTRHLFGEDVVIFRTRDGAVHASEPHCPHVGAHLGHGGRVVDDCLRCPFHGWRFDGTGQCVEIPGANRIPPRASLRTWSVRECNGVVFVWHHVDGVAPEWELPVLDNDSWTGNRTILWKVRTHPQEVFENVVDVAHLVPLHGVVSAEVNGDPIEDRHKMSYDIQMVADGTIVGMPGLTNDVTLFVELHGLGHTTVITSVHNAGVRARQRIYCTPIDEEFIEIRGAVNLEKLPDPAMTEQIAELFYRAYVTDFAMDFPVWENKIYRERPLLSSADGPFMIYRRWARQFYSRDSRTPALALAE